MPDDGRWADGLDPSIDLMVGGMHYISRGIIAQPHPPDVCGVESGALKTGAEQNTLFIYSTFSKNVQKSTILRFQPPGARPAHAHMLIAARPHPRGGCHGFWYVNLVTTLF